MLYIIIMMRCLGCTRIEMSHYEDQKDQDMSHEGRVGVGKRMCVCVRACVRACVRVWEREKGNYEEIDG